MGKRGAKTEAENDFNRIVGERIETERKEAGLTQAHLAKSVGIGQSLLYAYEAGAARCPLYRLRLLARILGVPVESLIPE